MAKPKTPTSDKGGHKWGTAWRSALCDLNSNDVMLVTFHAASPCEHRALPGMR